MVAVAATVAAATLHRSTPDEEPVPLTAVLMQHRTDQVLRTVKIQLSNGGDTPIQVVRAELRSPSFTGAGPVDTDTLVLAGDVLTDIRIGYGQGVCPASAAEPATALLTVREGERTREVALPLPYPNELLNSLLTADCEQAEVHKSAAATLTGLRSRPDGALDAAVTLTRVGGTEPVVMTDLKGSILYNLTPVVTTQPYGTLAPGQATVDIPIVIDTFRCDPHAVGEVKKPYEFPAWLAVGDAPTVYTLIDVPAAERATLFDLVRRSC
ncbi:hypothetical protein ACIA8K_00495 [Catenuloplanes sp. NPDC051500]|uniref:hypothetical protein n=1 Tax=Catenuloplanes sp. NPDC051500 TaxID=3363959 RepID=UPI00379A88E2